MVIQKIKHNHLIRKRKNRNIFKSAVMRVLTLPILLLSAVLALLVVITIRGIEKGRKLHIKLESLEKGNRK